MTADELHALARETRDACLRRQRATGTQRMYAAREREARERIEALSAEVAAVVRELGQARLSLAERTAEREALCERVSVLEAALRQAAILSGYTEADRTIPDLVRRVGVERAGEHG